MYRFERLIAVCAAIAFIGFAVAGWIAQKTDVSQAAQATNVTASLQANAAAKVSP